MNTQNSIAASVSSTLHLHPFGMQMPLRSYTGESYRFGFNGKEKDPEGMGGGGATYDYGFRIYNPQLGKFLSVDPLSPSYPWYTPYQFAGNTPIWAFDLDGLEEAFGTDYYNETTGEYYRHITLSGKDENAGTIQFKNSKGEFTSEIIPANDSDLGSIINLRNDKFEKGKEKWSNGILKMLDINRANQNDNSNQPPNNKNEIIKPALDNTSPSSTLGGPNKNNTTEPPDSKKYRWGPDLDGSFLSRGQAQEFFSKVSDYLKENPNKKTIITLVGTCPGCDNWDHLTVSGLTPNQRYDRYSKLVMKEFKKNGIDSTQFEFKKGDVKNEVLQLKYESK